MSLACGLRPSEKDRRVVMVMASPGAGEIIVGQEGPRGGLWTTYPFR